MTRTFEDRPAVRERVPLLIGLMGPSGGGKTFSALRLATGIQRVTGGDIYMVDTEARRGLHYADRFNFRHLSFGAPFSPLDYLAAIEHCASKDAGVVVVDSMSHEHEGPGGLLEMHEAEVQRLSGGNAKKANAVKMLAWSKPKQARRRLINSLLQLPVNLIFCFRAKEKLKIQRGKDPEPQGWMPIAGEEFLYEMTVNALLMPGAGGVPTWNPEQPGERQMVKLPVWAEPMLLPPRPFDEETGQKLAEWAAGDALDVRSAPELEAAYAKCADAATLGSLEGERRLLWRRLDADEKRTLKAAADEAKARVSGAYEAPAAGDPVDVVLAARDPGAFLGAIKANAAAVDASERWSAIASHGESLGVDEREAEAAMQEALA